MHSKTLTRAHAARARRTRLTPVTLAPRLAVPWSVIAAITAAVGLGYAASRAPVVVLVAAAAAVLAALTIVQARAMLIALIAFLPWEALVPFPSETVSAVKILGLLLVFSYLLRALAGSAPLQVTKVQIAVVLFALLIVVSLAANPQLGTIGVARAVRYMFFALFLLLIAQLAAERPAVLRLARVFCISMALACVYGVVGFLRGEVELVSGPIGDPNDFAYVVVVTLPLAGYLWISERGRRWLWSLCLIALVAGMLGTLSRGALVGLAALLVWALLTGHIPVRGVVLALLVVAATAFVGLSFFSPIVEQRLDSKGRIAQDNTQSRLTFWSAALYMAADRPLTGHGPGSFGVEGPRDYIRGHGQGLARPVVHNSYLEVLAENGVLALAAFLAFIGGSLLTVRRVRRRFELADDIEGVRLAAALEGAMVVAIVAGMFLSAAVIIGFWLIGGLIAALARDRHGHPLAVRTA